MIYVKVKDLGEQQGITAAQLARRANLSYQTVKRVWDDGYTNVDIWTLGRLADALNIDASELIESRKGTKP